MSEIERLVSAGIDRESAGEAVMWYLSQGDESKLELYVRECENRYCRREPSPYV